MKSHARNILCALSRCALSASLMLAASGCSRTADIGADDSFDGLFGSAEARVYADSISTDGSRVWHPSEYAASLRGPLRLASPSAIADTLAAVAGADTTASTLKIWLAGALVSPERSMEALRGLTSRGIIDRPGFPVSYTRAEWGAAAWDVYCATGSEAWLKEAYARLAATLRYEEYRTDPYSGLVRGEEPGLSDICPRWMKPADLAESISLYNNVWRCRTLEVMAMMAERLGLPASADLHRRAAQLREAINTHFWIPYLNTYGAVLYGFPSQMLSPVAEYQAQSLCALFGVATPEMAGALLDAMAVLPGGYPDIHPAQSAGAVTYSPSTQAFAALAASGAKSAEAFSTAVGALWLRAACGADVADEWGAILLRGILGLKPAPDGLRLSPFIPSTRFSPLTLHGLCWRDAGLTIRVHGTGDRIASFMIDSVAAQEPLVPNNLGPGRHTIDIVMAGNYIRPSEAKHTATGEIPVLPAIPEISLGAGGHVKADRLTEGAKDYQWYVDGVAQQCLPASDIPSLTLPQGSSGAIAAISESGVISWTGPQIAMPASVVEATSITPRRPPLNRIKDRETASRYVELAPRHNTRLTFYANIPSAGRYLARIVYSNGLDLTAERTLAVIDAEERHIPAGILVCPTSGIADWVTTTASTPVEVTLAEGFNRLSLTYITGTILFRRIEFYPLPQR